MSSLRFAIVFALPFVSGCDACNHEPVPFGLHRTEQAAPAPNETPAPAIVVTTLTTSATDFSLGSTNVRGEGIVFAARVESPGDASSRALYVEQRNQEWKLREYRQDGNAAATRDVASLTRTVCPVGPITLSAVDASTLRLDYRECVALDGQAELPAPATPKQTTLVLRVRGPAREIERIAWQIEGPTAPALSFRDADNDGNDDLEIAFTEPALTVTLRAQTNGFVSQSVHEQLIALHRRVRETRDRNAAATLSHQIAQRLSSICRESGMALLQVGSHVGIPCGERVRNQLAVQNAVTNIRAGTLNDGWLESVLQLRALMAHETLSDAEQNQLARAIADATFPTIMIENLEDLGSVVPVATTLQRLGQTFNFETATELGVFNEDLHSGSGPRNAERLATDAPLDGSNGYRLVSVREACGALRVELAKGDALGEAPLTRWLARNHEIDANACQVSVDPIRNNRFSERYPQGPYVVLALGVSGAVVARGRVKIFVPTAGDAPADPYILAADAPFPEPLQNWTLSRDRQSYAFPFANLVVVVSFTGSPTAYRIPAEIMHDRADVNIALDDIGLIWVHGQILYRGTFATIAQ